jgi:hypothetical protein
MSTAGTAAPGECSCRRCQLLSSVSSASSVGIMPAHTTPLTEPGFDPRAVHRTGRVDSLGFGSRAGCSPNDSNASPFVRTGLIRHEGSTETFGLRVLHDETVGAAGSRLVDLGEPGGGALATVNRRRIVRLQ